VESTWKHELRRQRRSALLEHSRAVREIDRRAARPPRNQ
jgi:hypothetical protein